MQKHSSLIKRLEKQTGTKARKIVVWCTGDGKPSETDPDTGERRILVEYPAMFRAI